MNLQIFGNCTHVEYFQTIATCDWEAYGIFLNKNPIFRRARVYNTKNNVNKYPKNPTPQRPTLIPLQ